MTNRDLIHDVTHYSPKSERDTPLIIAHPGTGTRWVRHQLGHPDWFVHHEAISGPPLEQSFAVISYRLARLPMKRLGPRFYLVREPTAVVWSAAELYARGNRPNDVQQRMADEIAPGCPCRGESYLADAARTVVHLWRLFPYGKGVYRLEDAVAVRETDRDSYRRASSGEAHVERPEKAVDRWAELQRLDPVAAEALFEVSRRWYE